ncbi:izumo sperm-egg fusion protein 4 isoform X2 [Bos javanicus]|uniref:izumo sperm-egg fusion protein 4 isoform X2 n=1 Tax=Bos taurus TaxID=9913 RepID=UPI0028CB6B91|nr:izumo sperm-egg fusion protein 4 isoform X2 [Bos taurus]XP_061278790.1 izumo sperm-egg fusion protein 4 isoform X2 [Bos javanicus]
MALLLCLGLTAALARGCLHCHGNFSDKFSFYRHHVNLKSWWVGDIPVSGSLLSDWSQDTMKELHLAIPAEITREKLNQVANAVYQRMDQLYQGKMYFPGYFPNELRAIFREQVHLIQNAIIESRIDCQRHCAPLVCCRHLPVRDYLLHQLHGFARRLLWLQLRVVSAVGESSAGPPPVHLDITKLHMSGAPTPGQPDSGKRLRVPDAALRAARPARPVPPRCGARTPLDRLGQTLWNRPTAAWGPHLPWSPGPGQAGAGRRGWEIDDFVYSTA